jgi:hypothetical protein
MADAKCRGDASKLQVEERLQMLSNVVEQTADAVAMETNVPRYFPP